MEETLKAEWAMPGLRLTRIDEAAERAFRGWLPLRLDRNWPWPTLVREGREDDPSAFEVAMWHGDELCGLAHGMGGKEFCAVEFVEGSPVAGHALKGRVLGLATRAAVAYAATLGRPEVRLIRPRPYVVRRVQEADPTIQLVRPRGGPHYLRLLV